jgi:hypothetical protein
LVIILTLPSTQAVDRTILSRATLHLELQSNLEQIKRVHRCVRKRLLAIHFNLEQLGSRIRIQISLAIKETAALFKNLQLSQRSRNKEILKLLPDLTLWVTMQLPPRREMDKSEVQQSDQDKKRTGVVVFLLALNQIKSIVRYLASKVAVMLVYMEILMIQAIDRRVNRLLLL